MTAPFLAIDWGTTNRRVYRIENGAVAATERDDRGVAAMQSRGFEQELAAIRERCGDLPVLMAGMVGSTIGWREAAYVAVPAGIEVLAANCLSIDARTAIVPGIAVDTEQRSDVMRGEEVQLLGAVAAGLVPRDAMLCQPGTHCKWAAITRGEVTSFTTAMTGEMFAMLRAHSVLARQMTAPVAAGPAFVDGVRQGAKRDLGATLFGIRAGGVLGRLAEDDAASFASGALIGSDVAARLAEGGDRDFHILADPELGGLYRLAIETLGGSARIVDSHAAFVAGITAIQELRA
ncbi:2-dehydro-3-deoxygalactonokinase [Sphingomonas japonica]|uniref:2-dehydro-3-deoxygalactonokinase n=1 Tax=Sphingomonas japonica TaxID=511662 RepID=A0ABX0TZ77_9SPHN|nr:2-dehydro-3-deoxygalactonokinase [Sphingomonas japonica]NIJ23533.1 2-dehydro-3-deoxygalactonokinase [Sphingomonas japonica]